MICEESVEGGLKVGHGVREPRKIYEKIIHNQITSNLQI